MNPKEYWEEADRLRRRIKRKENEILSLRDRAEGMTGMSDSDMPKTASPDPHKMEVAVCKVMELEQEVQEIQAELDSMISSFRDSMNVLTDSDMKDLLTKRYIEFKPWKIIFREMGYSKSNGFRIHQQALALIKFGSSWDTAGLDESSKVC